MAVEKFDSTGEAYDASNTCVESGTVLVIEEERVVGLAWAWPIAVTQEGGKFHDLAVTAEMTPEEMMAVLRRVLIDAQISWADVREAYKTACEHRWAVTAWCDAVATLREWKDEEWT